MEEISSMSDEKKEETNEGEQPSPTPPVETPSGASSGSTSTKEETVIGEEERKEIEERDYGDRKASWETKWKKSLEIEAENIMSGVYHPAASRMSFKAFDELKRAGLANVVELAEFIGFALYDEPGRIIFRELELAYLSHCLKRDRYKEMPVRTRRHVFFYWRWGVVKTTCIRLFFKECVPVVNRSHQEYLYNPDPKGVKGALRLTKGFNLPTYGELSGATKEAMRGSVSDGNLIHPELAELRFVLCTELQGFLGSSMDVIDANSTFLGQILEEGEIEVKLVKLRGLELTPEDEARLRAFNVDFRSSEGRMSYDPSCIFVGASHEVSKELWEKLKDSGFLSRLNIVYRRFTDEDVLRMMKRRKATMKEIYRYLVLLRRLNTIYHMMTVDDLGLPPHDLFVECVDELGRQITELKRRLYISPLFDTISWRDDQAIKVLLTIHAFMDAPNKVGWHFHYPNLAYDKKDSKFVKQYLKYYVQGKIVWAERRPFDTDTWKALTDLLSCLVHTGTERYDMVFEVLTKTLKFQSEAAKLIIADWIVNGWVTLGISETTKEAILHLPHPSVLKADSTLDALKAERALMPPI